VLVLKAPSLLVETGSTEQRAVHLELLSDMSTDYFLLALRRFIARRGQPETIWSDNGTNFVGVEKELKNSKYR